MPKQSYETELHNLGKLIKELRELFKLSQTSLAKLIGVNRSVIADIEQEKHLPNILTIFPTVHGISSDSTIPTKALYTYSSVRCSGHL